MALDLLEQAADLIYNADYSVGLTGAGISTPSGIPDFRSADSGLWTKVNPFEVASIQGFRYHPEAFYQWIRPLAYKIMDTKPNPAHFAMAQMERLGLLQSIITQNIDMLHTRAGSQTVYEVHGHIREMTCISCFKVVEAEPIMTAFLEDQNAEVPQCPHCNGVLKPNVILFGEQLPAQILIKAQQEMRQADLMLVAGSSLEVYPVADFPRAIKQHGGKLIIINLEKTSYDEMADVVIHGDVAEVIPNIVKLLEGKT